MPVKPEEIKDTWQFTRNEVAELLGVSPNTITNRVNAGALKVHYRSNSRQDTYFLGREIKMYLNHDLGRCQNKAKRASPRVG